MKNLINTPILKGLDQLAHEVENETLRKDNAALREMVIKLQSELLTSWDLAKSYLDIAIVKQKEVEKLRILQGSE